jgi:hypothetical protein
VGNRIADDPEPRVGGEFIQLVDGVESAHGGKRLTQNGAEAHFALIGGF